MSALRLRDVYGLYSSEPQLRKFIQDRKLKPVGFRVPADHEYYIADNGRVVIRNGRKVGGGFIQPSPRIIVEKPLDI